jgi:hypothetical protein
MAGIENGAGEGATAAASCHAVINHTTRTVSSVTTQLALIPLRSPSKQRDLEIKKLPIVLGRSNLSTWWYQSCDCQHYYCRLHCRHVAQNIGSLSKVMIQIDSSGKVFVVGKNPHLVTITPARNDQILQANDIVSIGRRDREPWMRFHAIEIAIDQSSVPVVTSTRNGKRSYISSCHDATQGSPPKNPRLLSSAIGNKNPINFGSVNKRTGSNLSSYVSSKVLLERQQQHQQQRQKLQ